MICPAVEKHYIVWNGTSGDFRITFKPSGGTGIEIPQGWAGHVFTDGSTMYRASALVDPSTGNAMLHSADAGASEGPGLDCYRQSTSPANNDILGFLRFSGQNDAGEKTTYGKIAAVLNDVTDGTEDGYLVLSGSKAGSVVEFARVTGNEIGILSAIRVYTSNDTWNKPAGLKNVLVEVVGGGGGGAGTDSTGSGENADGAGGGGGGYAREVLAASALGASETVTVGTGGAGGDFGVSAPANGGTSSFGALLSATGGSAPAQNSGATSADSFESGGEGGSGSGGDLNVKGGGGGTGVVASGQRIGGGVGGSSVLGGGARSPGAAQAGGAYGGGGGGASAPQSTGARTGGAGADGVVIVWEFV